MLNYYADAEKNVLNSKWSFSLCIWQAILKKVLIINRINAHSWIFIFPSCWEFKFASVTKYY